MTPRDGFKFHNSPTRVDGKLFASQKEARRFRELQLLERGGMIRDLETQPVFDLVVNGVRIAKAIPDFRYFDVERRRVVVEDVKSPGTRTQVYLLKKKLLKALFDIEVEEP